MTNDDKLDLSNNHFKFVILCLKETLYSKYIIKAKEKLLKDPVLSIIETLYCRDKQ